MAKAFRKFLPMFDRVLLERLPTDYKFLWLTVQTQCQCRMLQATVVALGPGATDMTGAVTPVSVKVGEKVLLPEKGGTKVVLDDKDYFLFRDAEILGKYVE
ncbi:10 kDa heat shock protein, mitochondrial-like isoform X3 [Tachysurus fulvidraco]|uniref:10 kDa heat shock protein, mitochondrial-like isoform X2 n=1 Tax=Tachysurus fulvidraco TaxID=1234273 RepID=UPI000F51250C|nr:10 kDa heat shock protein, mitochondrial-like isoform X2 [Tachysurus fulvidraco]XP_027035451.1 10 kDa heat shock protein, mitochondrial-like isoform X3 [Tachysurus fulvidraco]